MLFAVGCVHKPRCHQFRNLGAGSSVEQGQEPEDSKNPRRLARAGVRVRQQRKTAL